METFNCADITDRLRKEDYSCILDHLNRESCQLLKKIDRCELLLRIHEISLTAALFSDSNSKYLDQILVLLGQLSANESEEKFNFALKYLSFILDKSSGRLQGEEEALYQWAFEYVSKVDPSKEIQFYDIKMKYSALNSKRDFVVDGEEIKEIVDGDEQSDDNLNTKYSDEIVEESTLEDLQKLKIFSSFQME